MSISTKFSQYEKLDKVIAHRGASGIAPENTYIAIQKSQECGAKWIEVDIQLTTDHQLVVFHDFEIGRTVSGEGKVCDYSSTELCQMDAGSWFSKQYANQKILSIHDLFSLCNELGLGINLEVKCLNEKMIVPTMKALVSFLKEYPFPLPLEISSFNFDILYQIYRELPEIKLGILISGISPDIAETFYWEAIFKKINAYALHINKNQLSVQLIKKVKSIGGLVFVYTVNDLEEAKKIYQLGVDTICTDYPDKILKALKS